MDDLGYLTKEYVEDSYLFFVDSAKRDRISFRTPSQYAITFDKAFTNVVGLDVLRASVPRTEYLMDHDTNLLTYKIADDPWQQLEIGPGDYNINRLMDILSFGLTSNGKSIRAVSLSDILEINSSLKFVSDHPFQFNMSRSNMRPIIGFANPLYPIPDRYAMPDGYQDGDDEIFISKPDSGNVTSVNTFTGPSPITTNLPLSSQVTQRFSAASTGPISTVSLACGTLGSPTDALAHITVTDATGTQVATGNLIITDDGFKTPSTTTDISGAELEQNQIYTISFSTASSDAGNCYAAYFCAPSSPIQGTIYPAGVDGQDRIGYQLCTNIQQGGYDNVVIAPGIYNLTGQRYITLSCPEIEDHLYRDRPFDPYSVGLAKIPLGIFGFGESNYDFSGVPARTFQPIARLARLTFSLVRPDGELYDFKGVDHTFMMLLRYYRPPNQRMTAKSNLPYYQPDPHRYMVDHLRAEYDREHNEARSKIMGKLHH